MANLDTISSNLRLKILKEGSTTQKKNTSAAPGTKEQLVVSWWSNIDHQVTIGGSTRQQGPLVEFAPSCNLLATPTKVRTGSRLVVRRRTLMSQRLGAQLLCATAIPTCEIKHHALMQLAALHIKFTNWLLFLLPLTPTRTQRQVLIGNIGCDCCLLVILVGY